MKRIVPVFAVIFLGGCAATSPQYISQKQGEVLAKSEAICSQVDAAKKKIACLNWAVHNSGYWGQGVRVVAAKDGSLRLADYYPFPDDPNNVGGDQALAGAR